MKLLLALALMTCALGQDVKQLLKDGVALREQGRDAAALRKFRDAYALSESPQALAQVALAEQALGRWLLARSHLAEALSYKRHPWIARHRSALISGMKTIRSRLAQLELESSVAGAKIVVNGRSIGRAPLVVPVWVLAGTVVIRAEAEGYWPIVRQIQLLPKAKGLESLQFVPREPPPRESPFQETPFQETALQEAPLQETPLQETPLQETPLQETPLQEALPRESPVQDTPLQDTPLQETPPSELVTEPQDPPMEFTRDESSVEPDVSSGLLHFEDGQESELVSVRRTSLKPFYWTFGALAVVGAGVGTGFLLFRNSKADEFNDDTICGVGSVSRSENCPDIKRAIDNAELALGIGFVAAGVFAGTSVVLALIDASSKPSTAHALPGESSLYARCGAGPGVIGLSCGVRF